MGTALFLSLGLDPIVAWLERRKLPRWAAVLITILGVLAAFAGIILMVVPIIVGQISQLVDADHRARRGGRRPVGDIKAWLGGIFPNLNVDEVFAYVAGLGDRESRRLDQRRRHRRRSVAFLRGSPVRSSS